MEGRTIGEYRIVRFLGKGGMSKVYEAEHIRLGSRHAIKFFTYDRNADGVRERFLAEGMLLSRLSHPRVVRVTDTGTDPEAHQPYFVMDLVLGPEGCVRSLADVPPGSADESQIAMWYDDIREGLAYIHAKGIIHRDLKLENILIGPDGHAVLTDFGISKIAEAEDGAAVVDPVQTIVGLKEGKRQLMGSVGYMSPELMEMGASSPQSDYYALGVIAFHLLTGTWCDARTDLASYLETFDPAWQKILPKLLHSNPRGRECLSWRELKAADEERRLFAAENELDNLRSKSRRERIAAIALSVFVAAGVVLAGAAFHRKLALARQELSRAQRELSSVQPPTFEEIVVIPDDAPLESDDEITRGQFEAALPDAWILVHKVFAELRTGLIPYEKAVSDIEHFAERAASDAENDESLYGRYSSYSPGYERDALSELLRAAARRLRERAGKK